MADGYMLECSNAFGKNQIRKDPFISTGTHDHLREIFCPGMSG
jgi:hypothetical protein